MAFTRETNGLVGVIRQNDGKYDWILQEKFTGATIDSKTGDQLGIITIAEGTGSDYDAASAALKAAITAAG